MRHEAPSQPERHEDVEASERWETYSSMAEQLDEVVESLIGDQGLVRETPAEQNRRMEKLVECKSMAEELQGHIIAENMPVLTEQVAALLTKIQGALANKLH